MSRLERCDAANLAGRSQNGYTTWGCVWKKGQLTAESVFSALDETGKPVPIQSRVTAFWPDGSVKWSAHTADASGITGKVTVISKQEAANPKTKSELAEVPGKRWRSQMLACSCPEGWQVDTGAISFLIPSRGDFFFCEMRAGATEVISHAESVLLLEERPKEGVFVQRRYRGQIEKVELVENGPLFTVFRYEGIHVNEEGEKRIPFILYLKAGRGSKKLLFTHTFVYDGDEEKEFLKGLGITFAVPLKGAVYNRHVKFGGDYGYFHEACVGLLGGKVIPKDIYEQQMRGEFLDNSQSGMERVEGIYRDLPHWDRYDYFQDSVSHFGIRKKIADVNCCFLNCLDGMHAAGTAALGSENGSLLFGGRDFWERYPSGYTFEDLTGDQAKVTMWQWDPHAEAMDFRHYANRGYDRVYYEGYSWKGATPYGIGCTTEWAVAYEDCLIPSDETMGDFSEAVQNPPQYVCAPEIYHERKTFGYWSLPKRETPVESWLEEQLDRAFAFYRDEIRQRNWYGMFDYGDIMHSYDSSRHIWRYDMGGFAWDNTELVPTYWLWYMFLRTGRRDVFDMAERMCRHSSEVDVYHIGPMKGLGSRHNVRHWGCACKEVRIAMAGHHRFYYYLTGDYRLGEIFDSFQDAEFALLEVDPVRVFHEGEENPAPTHARSGPDWSSLCANWLVQWERFRDEGCRRKIMTGMEDIAKAPFGLVSGTDFAFDPESGHLTYLGESASGGSHLQFCMGSSELWMELADLMETDDWKKLLIEFGAFYFLDQEERKRKTGGLVRRECSLMILASAMGAYSAAMSGNIELAQKVWKELLRSIAVRDDWNGFEGKKRMNCGNRKELYEIEWIHTNFTAQWCLNVIVCLELIREWLPESREEAEEWLFKEP
ncbi:MAG: hypothetical protein IJ468_10930, partial [Lachnospiraceae bacterium]|nr:hypothetical protein [Lachnospiraceae bacterium]